MIDTRLESSSSSSPWITVPRSLAGVGSSGSHAGFSRGCASHACRALLVKSRFATDALSEGVAAGSRMYSSRVMASPTTASRTAGYRPRRRPARVHRRPVGLSYARHLPIQPLREGIELFATARRADPPLQHDRVAIDADQRVSQRKPERYSVVHRGSVQAQQAQNHSAEGITWRRMKIVFMVPHSGQGVASVSAQKPSRSGSVRQEPCSIAFMTARGMPLLTPL